MTIIWKENPHFNYGNFWAPDGIWKVQHLFLIASAWLYTVVHHDHRLIGQLVGRLVGLAR